MQGLPQATPGLGTPPHVALRLLRDGPHAAPSEALREGTGFLSPRLVI